MSSHPRPISASSPRGCGVTQERSLRRPRSASESGLPAELVDAFRPGLPDLAEEIIEAIRTEVGAYARPLTGEFGRGVRIGVERAVEEAVRVRTELDPSTFELEAMQLQAIESEEAAMLEASQRLALEPAVTPEEARRVAVQAEVTDLVERQPDEVAQLLRGWLADRRS